MDLITEAWLPVVTRSGVKKKIALTSLPDNDILDTAFSRSDFQGAAWQLLIGLVQSTVPPKDESDWRAVWKKGVDMAEWPQALAAIRHAMQFGAQKPAFLQSFERLDSKNSSVAGLLIDAPGENTRKLNKDHFVKRHVGERMCPHCAVIALFTLQTNSPEGGAGYRVSLRGSGPLTTLVVPVVANDFSLWQKLWLNVLPQEIRPQKSEYPAIFPWLTATNTCEKAVNTVTPEKAHPLQAYWGMPRRIELDFTATEPGECTLCGEPHPALLRFMRNKNKGIQYSNWLHPLSPYRQVLKNASGSYHAIKGQPGGLSYNDWLGLNVESQDNISKVMPATVVRAASGRQRLPDIGLWCFAWDMEQAKARCWYQHRIPLINSSDSPRAIAVIQSVVMMASAALQILIKQLKDAGFNTPGKVDLSIIDTAFWQETEPAFRLLLEHVIPDPVFQHASTRQALRTWETGLHHYLFQVFDREALTDPDSPNHILLRQLKARHALDKEYCKHKARRAVLDLINVPKESGNAEQ